MNSRAAPTRLIREMLTLQTSLGKRDWKLGDLQSSSIIFLNGYCSNFARVLYLRVPDLQLCVIHCNGEPMHYLCKHGENYLDVSGVHTPEELSKKWEGEVCDSIELEELEQNWEEEYDYLAERD